MPAQPPDPNQRARGDPAPDAQPALPDGERPPPVRRDFVPAGGEEVEAAADQAGGEAPQRDVVDELARAALGLPAARRDHHRGRDREHVHQTVHVDEQRPDVKAVERRAGEEGEWREMRNFASGAYRPPPPLLATAGSPTDEPSNPSPPPSRAASLVAASEGEAARSPARSRARGMAHDRPGRARGAWPPSRRGRGAREVRSGGCRVACEGRGLRNPAATHTFEHQVPCPDLRPQSQGPDQRRERHTA